MRGGNANNWIGGWLLYDKPYIVVHVVNALISIHTEVDNESFVGISFCCWRGGGGGGGGEPLLYLHYTNCQT